MTEATKRYAVVTGANKGVGLEICKQLAQNGIMVVLTARDEKRGLEALESLKHSGLSDYLVFHQLDVADPKSIASLADFVKKQFGKLDILVNNAAILGATFFIAPGIEVNSRDIWSKATDENYELAKKCIEINYYGAKITVEALIPLLQLSDLPRIVNVSSSVVMLKVESRVPVKSHFRSQALKMVDGKVSLLQGKGEKLKGVLIGVTRN
ncbi:hypothetical protein ES288_A07G166800v1 [Gossypium darwinii]|uniref:(+)-neomenthol dehydrogenase-like n=1 Tax=Gossypium darwinii TaxID=34276 RepID=A0A5D2FX53_GOSDA|nr:hypothetical protein ES288_A07G166800v1 [Gossypium darwinii]